MDTMDITHEPDKSELHDPAASIDNTAVANPQAYHKWNSLCTKHLVAFMQTLTSEAVDQLSKSEEMLQREFKAFLVRDLKVEENAIHLSLRQGPADPRNSADLRYPAAQVSQRQRMMGNHIFRELMNLSCIVDTIRTQLEKLEGPSGALRKGLPIELLTITESKVANLTEMEKHIRNRILAAYTLNQVLLDALEKLSYMRGDTGHLGFSDIDALIYKQWSSLKEYEIELDTMSTDQSFLGPFIKSSIIKKRLSKLGSPRRYILKLLKLLNIKRSGPESPDKKTREDREIKEKDDMVIRQSKYSEITRIVTDILAEVTKKMESAKKLKAIFLETGNRVASTSALQAAVEAGYSKEGVFENGVLVQRRFFKKGAYGVWRFASYE